MKAIFVKLLSVIATIWVAIVLAHQVLFVILTWFLSPEDLPFQLPTLVERWYDLQGVGPVDLYRGFGVVLHGLALGPAFFIFWIAKKLNSNAVADERAEVVERIVREYGNVLGSSSSEIRSTSELPYPKETIAEALITAMRVCPKGPQRDHLSVGFVLLSDFQDLSRQEQAAASRWQAAFSQSSADNKANFQERSRAIIEAGEILEPVQKAIADESADRLSFLKAEGLS